MARPRIPLISRERAVEAALGIIEQEGLESLTLERLAKTLGVRAPSLYHHFADKTDILEAAARALLVEVSLGAEPAVTDWRSWFRDLTLRTYRHVLTRPRAAKLLVEHFPTSLVFPAHEIGSRVLGDAGVPPDAIATVLRALEKLTFGLILADAAEVIARREGREDEVDGGRWPLYRAALDVNRRSGEQMLAETLEVFLDGVATRYRLAPESDGEIVV